MLSFLVAIHSLLDHNIHSPLAAATDNMFNYQRFALGPQAMDLVKKADTTTQANYRRLQFLWMPGRPLRWQDQLRPLQLEKFTFVTKHEDWNAVRDAFQADVKAVPVISFSLLPAAKPDYLLLSTFTLRTVVFPLPTLEALTPGWFRKSDYLPPLVRRLISSPDVFTLVSGTPPSLNGVDLRGDVNTESIFSVYTRKGVIKPQIVPLVPDLTWQATYALGYHHRPSSEEEFKLLVGPAVNFTPWPEHRKPGWRPRSLETLTAREEFFLFFEATTPILFVHRLLLHGLSYGGMDAVQGTLPLSEMVSVFLNGAATPVVNRDPLLLQSDCPTGHRRASPANLVYSPSKPAFPALDSPKETRQRGDDDGDTLEITDNALYVEMEKEMYEELAQEENVSNNNGQDGGDEQRDAGDKQRGDDVDRNNNAVEDAGEQSSNNKRRAEEEAGNLPKSPRRDLDKTEQQDQVQVLGEAEVVAVKNNETASYFTRRYLEEAKKPKVPNAAAVGPSPAGPPTPGSALAKALAALSGDRDKAGEQQKGAGSAQAVAALEQGIDRDIWVEKVVKKEMRTPPKVVDLANSEFSYHPDDVRAELNPAGAAAAFAQEAKEAPPRPVNLWKDRNQLISISAQAQNKRSQLKVGDRSGDQIPCNRRLLNQAVLSAEERNENPYVHDPKFHRHCDFCGGNHCSRFMRGSNTYNCNRFREHDRDTPTRNICQYRRCKRQAEHHTMVCPKMHRRCPRCLCPGTRCHRCLRRQERSRHGGAAVRLRGVRQRRRLHLQARGQHRVGLLPPTPPRPRAASTPWRMVASPRCPSSRPWRSWSRCWRSMEERRRENISISDLYCVYS